MNARFDKSEARDVSPAAPETTGSARGSDTIADVQGWRDSRQIAINWVGVRDVRHPLTVRDREKTAQPVTATVGMFVGLPAERKGTHMSRFLELLGENTQLELSIATLRDLMQTMLARLDADTGRIEISFAWFKRKIAPVSGVASLCDYEVTLLAETKAGITETSVEIVVPVTSLCPCSKEISDYGAHNQRSHITVRVNPDDTLSIDELIERVEAQASSEVYGVLKRADEKFVTERAYDNPKFVEDIVRDVAGVLQEDDRINAWTVTCENFESIHNHSAWATISSD